MGFILVPVCIWGFVSCDPRMHTGIQYAYGDYCMHIVREKIQWEYNIVTMIIALLAVTLAVVIIP